MKDNDRSDSPSMHPLDQHNLRWLENVHPDQWKNPEPLNKYDLLVIGGGPAGLVAALGAAGLGAKVALVEKYLLGGDCLNFGCVPSKSVIKVGRTIASLREIEKYGLHYSRTPDFHFDQAMERVRRIRADISHHDSARRITDCGVDVFLGLGQFAGIDTFEIEGKSIRFKKACIATGARPAVPPIEGLNQIEYLTNETVFALTKLPKRLAVIGAGPIGCEMAQSFARFGSEVHLVEAAHGILPRDDRDAAALVEESLAGDGVYLHCCSKNLKLARTETAIHLSVESHGVQYELEVDRLFVAAGRAPNVENLGLDAAQVECTKDGIKVDDYLRTTNRRIYAAGDVASDFKFTHAADFQARNVIRNALFWGLAKVSSLIIPWCTYTEPELAQIGRTSEDLVKLGIPFQTFTVRMEEIDRATIDGENQGFVRIHADRKGWILGGTIVASRAGDMIGALSIAMNNRIGLGAIASSIHPYPTEMEAIRKAGDAYNKTRLTPFAKKVMGALLALQR